MATRYLALLLNLFLSSGLAKQTGKTLPCNADAIPKPEYSGTSVTNLQAKEVHGWEDYGFLSVMLEPEQPKAPIDFCNVTVTYTHPGLNDEINVYIWLPLEGWNERFMALGGGGWAAGIAATLGPAVQAGYAGVHTDGNHPLAGDNLFQHIADGSFGLASPGVVDWSRLQNFASVALNDMVHLGKAVTTAFYSRAPKYSYWNGCSQGGRQGMMQAQRFPKNFDGILAMAPAVNWASFLMSGLWGYVVMKREGYYPPSCELAAIQSRAIEACDELDGVKDGVIAAQGLCDFDANTVVGQKFDCEGDGRKISRQAARIANAVWEGKRHIDLVVTSASANIGSGPKHPTRRGWYGLAHEASMGNPAAFGLVNTKCDAKNKNCSPVPFSIAAPWLKYFIKKDPDFDISEITEEQFWGYLHLSRQWYDSILGTDDPDLEEFRESGGKLISWHGLADQVIFPNGTANYYDRVLELDPKAGDFYRYFEAPGVAHCSGGAGAAPCSAFKALVDWVENGKAPEVLDAATTPKDSSEVVKTRPLCPYPKVAAYVGGDPDKASSFECADGFGTKKASEEFVRHEEL